MPAAYIPLLFYAVLVISFPAVALVAVKLLRKSAPELSAGAATPEHTAPGGEKAGARCSTSFCLIAMIFLILSGETLFLILWAIAFRGLLAEHLAALALFSMLVFLGISGAGYVWLYKKGALNPD
jgi:NADH-quinone oxidoreductase subunit A